MRGDWVNIDYHSLIVLIFLEPLRDLYDLETLWIEAKRHKIEKENRTGRCKMDKESDFFFTKNLLKMIEDILNKAKKIEGRFIFIRSRRFRTWRTLRGNSYNVDINLDNSDNDLKILRISIPPSIKLTL